MQGREKSSYPLSDSKPAEKKSTTGVILAKLSYKQTQYVDLLSVPRAPLKCVSETKRAFF